MEPVKVPIIDPADEAARLQALRDYRVLDTAHEPRFDDLTLLAARLCDAPIALISLVDADRLYFKSAYGINVQEAPLPQCICSQAIRQSEVFEVPDAAADVRFANYQLVLNDPNIRFYAAAPLVTPAGYAVGTLCVIDSKPRLLTDVQKESLAILGRQVIAQFELNLQAVRDPLTGLFNRRYMDDILDREVKRAERRDLSVSVIVADIDHFKRINDNHGHGAGDEVLRAFGKLLSENMRGEDAACRYGGEEFVMVMADMPLETARLRAEQIREKVKRLTFPVNGAGPIEVTVSCGVACHPVDGGGSLALLRAADQALYRAKAAGRDRVVVAKPN